MFLWYWLVWALGWCCIFLCSGMRDCHWEKRGTLNCVFCSASFVFKRLQTENRQTNLGLVKPITLLRRSCLFSFPNLWKKKTLNKVGKMSNYPIHCLQDKPTKKKAMKKTKGQSLSLVDLNFFCLFAISWYRDYTNVKREKKMKYYGYCRFIVCGFV